MMDIIDIQDGSDLILRDSDLMRAANVLHVQRGDLEYAPDWGVDTREFLESPVRFQNNVILSHFLERLAQSQINAADIVASAYNLYEEYIISIGDPPGQEGLQIEPGGQS